MVEEDFGVGGRPRKSLHGKKVDGSVSCHMQCINSDIIFVFIVDMVVLLVHSRASHSSNTVLQHSMITWISGVLICCLGSRIVCFVQF